MKSMERERPSTVRAAAFDPKSPSTLILPSTTSDNGNTSLNAFVADNGIGCNAEETSALMRIIDARDSYLESVAKATASTPMMHPKALCKTYRQQLIECIQQWEERIGDLDAGMDLRAKQNDDEAKLADEESIELLKLTHTIVQLCETFLLDDEDDIDGEMHLSLSKSSNTSGTVTADTVNYLRYNLMTDSNTYLEAKLGNELDMEQLLEMDQPEYYNPSGDGNSMTPYWCLVRKLILRGCLNEAWAVLSRHSACKRSSESVAHGGYVDPTVQDDNEAFALIRALLLSAPIPGGRDEINDDGLGLEEDEIEEEELLGGIEPSAYKQWDADEQGLDFNIHAILNLHKTWKNTVKDMVLTHTPLRNLMRRLPMLQECVWEVILNTSKCYQSDDVWAERLTAELVFVQPMISKEDIHVRAADHMKQSSSQLNRDEASAVEEILLQIMKGNAGVVIQALNSYGGGSSAALPATMSALLCNLLVENGKIELSQLSFDIETELFLSASSAILSSFAMQNHNDVGVRLSTHLLQPHVIPENNRVTAFVAETLCRYWPKSDAETKSLLESCKESVCRGSRRIVDACDSLAFTRSMHHVETRNVEKSVSLLIRGIEMASFFGLEVENNAHTQYFLRTICFRQLTITCSNSTAFILKQIFDCFLAPIEEIDVAVLTEPLQSGRIIVDTVTECSVVHLIESDPSVLLLKYVVDLGLSLILGEKSKAANAIINCLEDKQSTDGSIIVLAHAGFYGYLLSSAFDILVAEDSNANLASATSSFDLIGMQVLFSRFTQYCSEDKIYFNQESASTLRPDVTPYRMREALGKGLMRAFICENAKIASNEKLSLHPIDDNYTEDSVEKLLASSLL
jgi:hypothetical protein